MATQTNVAYVSTTSANPQSQEDPLYSVLDNPVHGGYTQQPPALPPDRVPYYQEIESDRAPAPYDTLIPMAQPKPDSEKSG